jgi:hypothetical protein
VKLLPPAGIVPLVVAPSPQSIVARRQAFVLEVVEPLATVAFSSAPSVPVTARPVMVTEASAAGAAAQNSAKTATVRRITAPRLPGPEVG